MPTTPSTLEVTPAQLATMVANAAARERRRVVTAIENAAAVAWQAGETEVATALDRLAEQERAMPPQRGVQAALVADAVSTPAPEGFAPPAATPAPRRAADASIVEDDGELPPMRERPDEEEALGLLRGMNNANRVRQQAGGGGYFRD